MVMLRSRSFTSGAKQSLIYNCGSFVTFPSAKPRDNPAPSYFGKTDLFQKGYA